MSKLDAFVKVKYQRKLSQFSDIDFDTVVVISETIVGEDGKIGGKTTSKAPLPFSSASSFPETLSADIRNIGKRVLNHGKRVCFWNKQLKNKFCYLFVDYIENVGTEIDKDGKETGNWDKGEGNDKFMLVFPAHLYGKTGKYQEEIFAGSGTSFDTTIGRRIVVCGSRDEKDDNIPPAPENPILSKEKIWVSNNTFIAASVAGVIAGGYRNFTTHLRQIINVSEDRQRANPSINPKQSSYIGSVVLAGNSFIEGSMTYGVKNPDDPDTQISREYIDRQVLEDRLQSRLQEECLPDFDTFFTAKT